VGFPCSASPLAVSISIVFSKMGVLPSRTSPRQVVSSARQRSSANQPSVAAGSAAPSRLISAWVADANVGIDSKSKRKAVKENTSAALPPSEPASPPPTGEAKPTGGCGCPSDSSPPEISGEPPEPLGGPASAAGGVGLAGWP